MTQAAFNFAPPLSRKDKARLGAQLIKVRDATLGAGWLTLSHISELTGAPQPSVSARLRDLRAYGLTVERKRAAPDSGLWMYRVTQPGGGA